ncbi:MAG: succinylglutamate desuccinylase/aspartoacylase family protein [Verrucomicrobiota bacterium]|jgi:predicted deacylase|nr:succinylglutamate desuccinylase/aspartoacylase family protein [Verrucomicrobiota bacterium]
MKTLIFIAWPSAPSNNRSVQRLMFSTVLWVGFALQVVAAETLSSGVLAKGTPWETAFYRRDSGEAGPVVVVTGGVHGNEPAGARAAEQIRHWPIKKGRLIVVPRTNIPGLKAGSRHMPGEPEKLRDLNRNFPMTDGERLAKGVLAKALWEFVASSKPDWLVDLHEGSDFHQINSKSVGSSIIDVKGKAADSVVPTMLEVVNAEIPDPRKKLVRLRYPVDGSLARAAHERLQAVSMILETTSKDQPVSIRARQHRLMVHTLLGQLGMIDGPAHRLVPADSTVLSIAVYDAEGVGKRGPRNLDRVFSTTRSILRRVGVADIRDGVLGQFDMVIFPGGSGSKQAAALGKVGKDAVRDFVDAGGGYVGICAGAFLAASNYSWSLGISNHKTFCETIEVPGIGRKSMWFRGGSAPVTMELTDEGRTILGDFEGVFEVRYQNGPIMSPMGVEGLGNFRSLAHFRSEVSKYKLQEGTMINTPAVIVGEYGRGRVLCISPHPESTDALNRLVQNAVRWTARRR